MEEVIFQLLAAGTAEDALPDLGTGNIVKYLLTDAVSDKRILTFSGKGIGQDIITVDDQFCVRYAGDGCLQLMESDVNFAESIQLVPGNICQQSTVWFQLGEHADGSDLIHFNTGIICIQPAVLVSCKYKGRNNSVEHIGSGTVNNHFFPFCF